MVPRFIGIWFGDCVDGTVVIPMPTNLVSAKAILRVRKHQALTKHRIRSHSTLAAQRPVNDLCYTLRSAPTGIFHRNSRPFCLRYYISPLCVSRSIGIQGDHHHPATVCILIAGERNRWRVPMLSPKILSIEVRFWENNASNEKPFDAINSALSAASATDTGRLVVRWYTWLQCAG